MSPHRNWTRRPTAHRAVQHPGLHRLPVAGSVQWDCPHQVRAERPLTGPDNTDRDATCGSLASVLPGKTSGIELWGLTPHHPANVCRNRSLASGQHRWESLQMAFRKGQHPNNNNDFCVKHPENANVDTHLWAKTFFSNLKWNTDLMANYWASPTIRGV